MPDAIQQDEEDVVRYSDSPAPVSAPPSLYSTQQAAPVTLPGSPDYIGAAVGQLNAGQPVTALPHQSWSLPEAQSFNARLDAFDQQAKAARAARDAAARDAQMLDQMMRVAKSTKDIEVAMQTQDQIGFRSAVAAGTPALQAIQRFPRAATSPLVAALHAAQVHPPMSNVAVPITTPEGEVLGYGTETGPTTRHIMPKAKAVSTAPTAAQEISALRARAALKEQQFIVSSPKKGSPEEKKFLDDLAAIDKRLEELSADGGKAAPAKAAAAPAAAPAARIRLRRKSDGKVFTYPGAAADVPLDRYEVLP